MELPENCAPTPEFPSGSYVVYAGSFETPVPPRLFYVVVGSWWDRHCGAWRYTLMPLQRGVNGFASVESTLGAQFRRVAERYWPALRRKEALLRLGGG